MAGIGGVVVTLTGDYVPSLTFEARSKTPTTGLVTALLEYRS